LRSLRELSGGEGVFQNKEVAMDDVGLSPEGRIGFISGGVTRRLVIAASAALALLCVAPALASARVHWRLNGQPLSETTATKGKGTVKLTDTKYPIVGTVAIECEDTVEGSAAPAAGGSVAKWTLSKCVAANSACEKAGTVEMQAVNLSWNAELLAAGSGVNEKLQNSGKGMPGFKWRCMIFGIYTEDVCTAPLVASTTNVASGVSATFVAGEKLNCADSGEGTGKVEGSTSVEATNGGKLSAELEKPPLWRVNGTPITAATAVNVRGTIAMSDVVPIFGTLEVECEDTGTGLVGPSEISEMTKWTISKCVNKQGCSGPTSSIEALRLPWHGELYSVEGAVRNLTSGGAFKFTCTASGETIKDECEWVPAATLTNAATDVTAAWREKRTCSVGKSGAGNIVGSQEISTTSGTLSAS
jgi:hypothetical protein